MNALCQMTGISRAGYYRWRMPPPSFPVEMELRDAMQQIALEFPSYGYRRITMELNRRGFAVNHKRVLRLMREDNLLCLRRKAFAVTTDSRHTLPVYPNLARDITQTASISCGAPILLTFGCAPSSSTWRWCWTPTRGA